MNSRGGLPRQDVARASVSRVMRATPDHRQEPLASTRRATPSTTSSRGSSERFATPTSSSSAAKRIRSSAQRTPRITPASPKLHGSAALASAGAGAKSPEEHADLQRALARAQYELESPPPGTSAAHAPVFKCSKQTWNESAPMADVQIISSDESTVTYTYSRLASPAKQDHQTQQLRSPTGSVRAAPDR
jgi:hypothetical protein